MNENEKKTEIERLAKLIGQIPEKGIEARKVYSAFSLFRRMNRVCFSRYDETSNQVLVENLELVGKRIAQMRYEFGKSDFDEIMRYVVDDILDRYGNDDERRKEAIENIEDTFREHEKEYNHLKERRG